MKVLILNNNGSISIRFNYKNKLVKFNPIKLGRFDDETDYSQAVVIQKLIEYDLKTNQFDETLEKYKQTKNKPSSKKRVSESSKEVRTSFLLIELWDRWVESLRLPTATKNNHYALVRKMIISSNPIAQDSTWLKAWESKLAPKTFSDRFSYLKTCLDWSIKQFSLPFENPYADYKKPKQKTKVIKPFTLAEVSRILTAIRDNQFCRSNNGFNHSHYLPLFQFLFQTGTRPGEAIALTWNKVDFEFNQIEISESLSKDLENKSTSKRKRKDTKTGNIRFLPMPEKLRALLIRIKPEDCKPNYLVFVSPKGDPENGFIEPNNLSNRVWKPVLLGLGLEVRPLYQIRHTFLSHAVMDSEIGLLGAAQLAGHVDARMISRHYARFAGQAKAPEMLG